MGIKTLVKGEFPQLRRELDFGEFHADLAGNTVDVWLNPSADHRAAWGAFREALGRVEGEQLPEALKTQRASLWAALWGCEPYDAATLLEMEGADGLIAWLCERTWAIIRGYADERAKAASD